MPDRPNPIYEALYTRGLQAELGPDEAVAELRDLDPHEAPERLARHLAQELARALRALPGDAEERRRAQAEVANRLLQHLRAEAAREVPDDVAIVVPPQELRSRDRTRPPPRTALPFSINEE